MRNGWIWRKVLWRRCDSETRDRLLCNSLSFRSSPPNYLIKLATTNSVYDVILSSGRVFTLSNVSTTTTSSSLPPPLTASAYSTAFGLFFLLFFFFFFFLSFRILLWMSSTTSSRGSLSTIVSFSTLKCFSWESECSCRSGMVEKVCTYGYCCDDAADIWDASSASSTSLFDSERTAFFSSENGESWLNKCFCESLRAYPMTHLCKMSDSSSKKIVSF